MSDLQVYGGDCCLCDVGVPVSAEDESGKPLHTGDIVQVWSVEYAGTDIETHYPCDGLTCVVSDQFTSYSDGTIIENDEPSPFVMGIKSVGFNDPQWRIRLVKSFKDVVVGEHWPQYGFRYNILSKQDEALIAAAPDLLEALEEVQKADDEGYAPDRTMIDTAIAKARGKT